jgi:hypothetical protein
MLKIGLGSNNWIRGSYKSLTDYYKKENNLISRGKILPQQDKKSIFYVQNQYFQSGKPAQ